MNLKEDFKKEIQEGILLDGLTKLLESNTENILAQTKQMNDKWALMMNATKSEATSNPVATEARVNKVTKLTIPAKVPSWTKDMSLETYIKQLTMWTAINTEVPEYVKYHDLIEELKRNK